MRCLSYLVVMVINYRFLPFDEMFILPVQTYKLVTGWIANRMVRASDI